MPDGRPVFTFVFDEIRKFKADAMPVASLDCTPKVVAQIAAIVATDKKGVGVRARIEHVMKTSFGINLDALFKTLKATTEETDLIVDLGTPNYQPYAAFAAALAVALGKIPNLPGLPQFHPRRLRLPGHAQSSASSPIGYIERHDWKFYVKLLTKISKSMRSPLFGDYATVNPGFTAKMDMRKVNPAGKIVYTTTDKWFVRKGGAFRGNEKQMHKLSDEVVKSGLVPRTVLLSRGRLHRQVRQEDSRPEQSDAVENRRHQPPHHAGDWRGRQSRRKAIDCLMNVVISATENLAASDL